MSSLVKVWIAVSSVWNGVWSVLGPLGNVVQWLFQTSESFFLFVKRQQFWLLNKTTWWSASFQSEAGDSGLEQLQAVLPGLVSALAGEEGFQVLRDLPEDKVVKASGIIFEFHCSVGFLHVQISDQKISFRDSRRLIEMQLFRLLERIEKSVGECDRRYSLTAKFGSQKNPYLSTYLARLEDRLILSFDCKYRLTPLADSPTISVNRDSVSVVADSREQFRHASLRVLALSKP